MCVIINAYKLTPFNEKQQKKKTVVRLIRSFVSFVRLVRFSHSYHLHRLLLAFIKSTRVDRQRPAEPVKQSEDYVYHGGDCTSGDLIST